MKKIIVTSLLVVLLGNVSCVKQTKRAPIYNKSEYNKMTLCIGMADTAHYIARSKLAKKPAKEIKDYYANKPHARMNLAMVDKIYKEKVTNAWDYTISFFDECALNMAGVVKARVEMARYCSQNAMIADVAYGFKTRGQPKQNAYKTFAKFKSKTPNEIIDKVYASSKPRSTAKLDAWNECMTPISG